MMRSLILLMFIGIIAAVYCCEKGETKKEDCNTCNCANGNWVCSRKICPPQRQDRKKRETCKEGETKMDRCNACKCIKGKYACTRRSCPQESRKRRAASTPDRCTPGEDFMYECNTCHCMADGRATCTFRLCP